MKSATRLGSSGPSPASTARRSRPGTNRIAMNSTPPASPASYTGMMCGSSTAAADLDSAMNRRRNSSSAASPGASTFSATSRPSRSSRARYTTAIPPAPTCASSRYPATSAPAPNPASNAGKSSPNTPPTGRAGTKYQRPHLPPQPTLSRSPSTRMVPRLSARPGATRQV
jgi:hypothetical protein